MAGDLRLWNPALDEPPDGWAQRIMRDPAFDAAGGGAVGGIGGTLAASTVSAMKVGLRSKVHTASKWLAELAAISASAPDEPEENAKDRHSSYLVLRYLSALCSLFVSLCNLPPRQEYLPLFREMTTFIEASAITAAADADGEPGRHEHGLHASENAAASAHRRRVESDLSVAGRAALLGELNDLCSMLSPQVQNEAELLVTLKRAVGAMRGELQPLLASLAALTPTGTPPPLSAGPMLLSPGLRMSGNRGGGGGSDLHNSGLSFGSLGKPWKTRHAIPTGASNTPAWLAKSESMPGLPELRSRTGSRGPPSRSRYGVSYGM